MGVMSFAGMVAPGSGSIINISSMAGRLGLSGGAAYGATKAALASFTQAWAAEYSSRGVRVNAVAPGPVDTELLARFTGSAERKANQVAGVPLKRAGKPEEIAQAIVFLASDKADFITGQVVGVNGGKTAQ
jgi:NAD(P)-dependent dehydrogenase (short-subunit alcohol dehydrogenase family)